MSKTAITLGLILGASLAPGFNTIFKTAREKAQGLKSTLADARLGAGVASDVARLGARLERMRTVQASLGTENVKLANRIAQTQRELHKAAQSATRYGVTIDNAAARQRHFAEQADKAAQALGRLQAAQSRQGVREEIKGELLGTVGAVMAVSAPIKESLEFEHRLRAVGNIADLSGQQIEALGQSVLRTGAEVNQTSEAMTDAYNVLLGKGLDPGRSTALLGSIGKTATATQASIEDLSVTTFALIDNLKLAESQIPKAMDMLAQAGKEGSFELKDMAKFFPQLTSQLATLGMAGPEAVATLGSALQVAMKGAGSPEEAAQNLKNFLQKMTAPDTVKNFSEAFGVNLETSMKEAMKRGENPVEYMIGLINTLTKGDKFRIGELFGDMQVGNFLAPMMQNMEEYREIKAKTLGASGVVDRDFANMMATGSERIKNARIELSRLGVTLGNVLLPAIGVVADGIGGLISTVSGLAQRFPALTVGVTSVVSGLVLFKVVSLAARFGGTLLLDSAFHMLSVFRFFRSTLTLTNAALVWNKVVTIASAVAAGAMKVAAIGVRVAMLGWTAVMPVLTAAQWAWNVALNANPIGLVVAGVAALAGAAYLIYDNWEPITAWFANLWDSVATFCGQAMQRITAFIKSPLDALQSGAQTVLGWFGLGKDEAPHSPPPPSEPLGQTVPAPAPVSAPSPVADVGKTVPRTAAGLTADKATALQNDPAWQSPQHQAILQKAIAKGDGGVPELGATVQSRRPSKAETSSPGASTAPGPSRATPGSQGLVLNNTFNLTGVGLETVQDLIKRSLADFARDLDLKLQAVRDQQARLSFG